LSGDRFRSGTCCASDYVRDNSQSSLDGLVFNNTVKLGIWSDRAKGRCSRRRFDSADSYGVCQGEYRNNGLVSKIIIDRGPQFTSKFWSELMSKRDTKLGLSSSYHAQAYPTQMVREKELIELYNSM
jgi:hypothetical protein